MLSLDWKQHKPRYDFVVVGSGYGGAITAARIASANLNPKPSVCVIERGQEWSVESFPDTPEGVAAATRSSLNPLGLFELLTYNDISVIKGSGLGGTSLINANVAIVPDREVFERAGWPRSLSYETMLPYYERARLVLDAWPHPRAFELKKVQALERRAREIGARVHRLALAVNFTIDGPNPHGVQQKPCIDCGDCVTGCRVGAKNTLYMNYLPIARNAGAEIYTQTKVEWIEKLAEGGWRVHGRHYKNNASSQSFNMEAGNVILAAGSINSTEILMRSEMRGLSLSPALGTGFSGNGDFFALAYNGDHATQVLGFGKRPESPGAAFPPGPNIVGTVRYDGGGPVEHRITIEDFSFPSASVAASKAAFAVLRGEDTDVGDEEQERRRVHSDLDPFRPFDPDGALNHTMLYLVMGFDDARGRMVFEAPWFERDGRMRIHWDDAGRQVVFTRINDELRRHARALGASFIENPLWSFLEVRHLITAHPLGGCPIGEDHLQGAVDEHGRAFAADGSVHEGLFVADGALVPSALGVNPFLTISALAERIAERKIRQLQGDSYPAPRPAASFAALDPVEAVDRREAELERVFRSAPSLGIDVMLNSGTRRVDAARRLIENDEYWKGFFPKGHILNQMSSLLFTGFQKRFFKEGRRYAGLTTDTDGRIRARNSLEELNLDKRKGDLDPGRYILLRYIDPPWQGFYDVFKVISPDLLIGRVYLGEFPNGVRMFTFPMTRRYSFAQMTVEDHRRLFESGTVPTKEELNGVWRMDVVSNANQAGGLAHLKFDLKPDGRLESRYQLMGLIEGLVAPSFATDHFQLNDFTGFHDEIRTLDKDLLVGKYVVDLPPEVAALFPAASLGILHVEEAPADRRRFGFYYLLSRSAGKEFPAGGLLRPFLDVHLPDGLGMTFDEEMTGWFFPGQPVEAEGRAADLTIAERIPPSGAPPGAVACSFRVRMTVKDLNEFIDGAAHEARVQGALTIEQFAGQGPATFPIDERRSFFNYLRVNEATGEAEMRYHLEFRNPENRRFTLEGRKYMQKDESGLRGLREVLDDYTTLFARLYEETGAGRPQLGAALLKFRTFEDLAAVGNLTEFLRSFRVTGTSDPLLQLQGQMRFLAFTARFVQQEYDPLSPDPGALREDVRAEVLRGAETPDYFSTRPTTELQAILRDTPTLPLEALLNRGEVRVDFEQGRIFRDSFWKGSFAQDTLPGWEERVRGAALGAAAEKSGSIFAGGSFWKRFDRVDNGVAAGYVVNYELDWLPGDPAVRRIEYPLDGRRYLRKGDPILLLEYRNDPYRLVYDTIKVIDENNAAGVMHLGRFPDGVEFATFVMARHNYPLEKMSVQDHQFIFGDPRTSTPATTQLEGEWEGHLVFLTRPNVSLLNQVNPVIFRLGFKTAGSQLEGRYRFGLLSGGQPGFTEEFVRLADPAELHHEIRMINTETLIGKWAWPQIPPLLLGPLRNYLEAATGHFGFYYVMKRARAAVAVRG